MQSQRVHKFFVFFVTAAVAVLWTVPAVAQYAGKVRVVFDSKHDVSLPLRDLAQNAASEPRATIVEKDENRAPSGYFTAVPGDDPVVQERYLARAAVSKTLSFDGMTDRQACPGCAPPDTNGSAGNKQFVEITNVALQVYNKATGLPELPKPVLISTLWKGFAGPCESTNVGDPVVLFDKMAQRWLVTQLSIDIRDQIWFLCLAVSRDSDAAGRYNRYEYPTGSNLPDYPKYAVWPDAYYGTHNLYSQTAFLGAEPCAFDRAAMLAGASAAMICIPPDPSNFGFLPSDMDGALPPHGSPNHYVELGNLTNELKEFDFHADFSNPQNSTFTGPNVIKVPNYVLLCSDGGNFACVPQPTPGEKVDSLSGLLMFRNAYRNFGDHESMVMPHAVAPGKGSSATVATRWYELRSSGGGAFSLYQAGTFQSSADNLWMASMAMDKHGNIAMGMSADSAADLDTSIWYTGRTAADPLGQMEAPTVVVTGSAVQVNAGNRWGDYSSMSVDPSDDCTFWYSQEYYNKKNGGSASGDWTTHIVSFRFPDCN